MRWHSSSRFWRTKQGPHSSKGACRRRRTLTSQAIAEADPRENEQAPVETLTHLPELVIVPPTERAGVDLRELWRYRELLYFLTWRDVKVRYKQTALGAAWAILQPTLTMLVFTLFFGRLGGMENRTGEVPYPVFALAGLVPWTFFSNAVSGAGNSIVGSTHLITKVYFPRLIVPLAAITAGLVDFAISMLVLLAATVFFGGEPTWTLVLVPLFIMGITLAATGAGTLIAALTVHFRDFRHALPFLIQLWMFVTPVIYPSSIVPQEWRWVLALNPVAGLIEGFRNCIVGSHLDWNLVGISLGMALCIFAIGVLSFERMEHRFADAI